MDEMSIDKSLQAELGSAMEVAEEVWEDLHNRCIALPLSSFLPSNYLAMEDGSYYDVMIRHYFVKIYQISYADPALL